MPLRVIPPPVHFFARTSSSPPPARRTHRRLVARTPVARRRARFHSCFRVRGHRHVGHEFPLLSRVLLPSPFHRSRRFRSCFRFRLCPLCARSCPCARHRFRSRPVPVFASASSSPTSRTPPQRGVAVPGSYLGVRRVRSHHSPMAPRVGVPGHLRTSTCACFGLGRIRIPSACRLNSSTSRYAGTMCARASRSKPGG